MNFFTNWKTTFSGIATILTGVGDIIHSTTTKQPVNWNVDIATILGGIGLIFAKDATTHSTTQEVQAATIEKEAK